MQPRDGVRGRGARPAPLALHPPSVGAVLPWLTGRPLSEVSHCSIVLGRVTQMSPMAGVPPPTEGLPTNPYWEGITELCHRGHAEIQHNILTVKAGYGAALGELRARYGHAISDPGLVQWVAGAVGRSVVEIDARAGYWSWMLHDMGVFTITYDPKPPHEQVWVPVLKSGRDRAELRYRDYESATLLAVMPASFTKLQVALRAFSGRAFVVITDDAKIRNRPETFGAPEWTWWASHRGVCLGGHLIAAHLYKRAVKPTDPPWQAPTQKLRTVPPKAP